MNEALFSHGISEPQPENPAPASASVSVGSPVSATPPAHPQGQGQGQGVSGASGQAYNAAAAGGGWNWGRYIAVGVVQHPVSRLWHSWVSFDGRSVHSLTANLRYEEADQVAQNYIRAYQSGHLTGAGSGSAASTTTADPIDQAIAFAFVAGLPSVQRPPANLPDATLVQIGQLIAEASRTTPFTSFNSGSGTGTGAGAGTDAQAHLELDLEAVATRSLFQSPSFPFHSSLSPAPAATSLPTSARPPTSVRRQLPPAPAAVRRRQWK